MALPGRSLLVLERAEVRCTRAAPARVVVRRRVGRIGLADRAAVCLESEVETARIDEAWIRACHIRTEGEERVRGRAVVAEIATSTIAEGKVVADEIGRHQPAASRPVHAVGCRLGDQVVDDKDVSRHERRRLGLRVEDDRAARRVRTCPKMKGYGLALVWVYLIWACIILLLYPLCKWFDCYKQSHKEKEWLSYL